MSNMMKELFSLMNVHKTSTTPYSPQSDGKNENSHKFLMQIVRILCEKHPHRWCDMAKVVAFGWNTSTLAALDYLTPYELQFGQMANMPHAMTLRYDDICPPNMEPKDYRSYAEYLDMTLDQFTAAFKAFLTAPPSSGSTPSISTSSSAFFVASGVELIG